jgi:hypothetical protein
MKLLPEYVSPCGSRWICASVLALVLMFADVLPGVAQLSTAPRVGSRVRITAPGRDLDKAVGTVRETTRDAIVVHFRRMPGDTLLRSDITAIDVSVGRKRRTLRGAGVGALVGVGVGALIGFADGGDILLSAQEKAAVGAIVLGVVGSALGLIIGSAVRTDVWAPLIPDGLEPVVLPISSEGGVGLRIGLTFPF